MTDEDLLTRANRAYFRRYGKQADFPSGYDSSVKWRPNGTAFITLANGNGVLAIYDYDPRKDRLKRLD